MWICSKTPKVPESVLKKRKQAQEAKAKADENSLRRRKVGGRMIALDVIWCSISYQMLRRYQPECFIDDARSQLSDYQDCIVACFAVTKTQWHLALQLMQFLKLILFRSCWQARLVVRQRIFKRAEQYAKEYKSAEREVIKNKRDARREGNFFVPAEPKVALVIRIRGYVENLNSKINYIIAWHLIPFVCILVSTEYRPNLGRSCSSSDSGKLTMPLLSSWTRPPSTCFVSLSPILPGVIPTWNQWRSFYTREAMAASTRKESPSTSMISLLRSLVSKMQLKP